MRVAVVGARGIQIEDLGAYLPEETSMIVSGGVKGVDSCARKYAGSHGIRLLEFFPEYERYGRAARSNAMTVFWRMRIMLSFFGMGSQREQSM